MMARDHKEIITRSSAIGCAAVLIVVSLLAIAIVVVGLVKLGTIIWRA